PRADSYTLLFRTAAGAAGRGDLIPPNVRFHPDVPHVCGEKSISTLFSGGGLRSSGAAPAVCKYLWKIAFRLKTEILFPKWQRGCYAFWKGPTVAQSDCRKPKNSRRGGWNEGADCSARSARTANRGPASARM